MVEFRIKLLVFESHVVSKTTARIRNRLNNKYDCRIGNSWISNTNTVDMENNCSRRIDFPVSSIRKLLYGKPFPILGIVSLGKI